MVRVPRTFLSFFLPNIFWLVFIVFINFSPQLGRRGGRVGGGGGGGEVINVRIPQLNSPRQRLSKIMPSPIAGGKGGVVYMNISSASYHKGEDRGGGGRVYFPVAVGNINSVT